MNKYFDFLVVNFTELYKNKTLEDKFVSKIFTFVNEKHQYIFINQYDEIKGELESDFYRFLVKKYNANCYSRGALFVNEKEEQTIILVFIDKTDEIGIEMVGKIHRNKDNEINGVDEFKSYKSKKKDMIFGWLFDEDNHTSDKLEHLNNIHEEIKHQFIISESVQLTKQ